MALSNSRGGCYPPRPPPPRVTAKMDNSLLAKLIFRLKYSSQICIKSAEKKENVNSGDQLLKSLWLL